jgi:hypothetical protein
MRASPAIGTMMYLASTSKMVMRRSLKSTIHTAIGDATQESFSPGHLETRINGLVNHPAVVWNTNSTFTSMHKKKLAQRHLSLFDASHNNGDVLFDEFATAVCNAGVVARKEVFETWASALHIHDFFFNRRSNKSLRRVADIAAGHGLLAWALLILDDEQRKLHNDDIPPLTAFCLDVQMPKSAELIQSSMLERFTHLENQFDYVEGRLEQLVPHKSCLLAGVHACGTLSDVLVATAAEQGIPLALVPCCHSRKVKVLQSCASPYAKKEYDAILNTKDKIPDLANRLDAARVVALKNSGLDVVEASIPSLFTDKNRLIMATPGERHIESSTLDKSSSQMSSNDRQRIRLGQMPPLNANEDYLSVAMINSKARFMKGFYVPCQDDHEHRSIVSDIAGRSAAVRRKEVMHNRNHHETPQLDVSMWLPADGSDVTEQSLSDIVTSCHKHIHCRVIKLGDVYIDPKTSRRAQTFRVQYGMEEGVLSFDEANKIHKTLYQSIPSAFPGAECR